MLGNQCHLGGFFYANFHSFIILQGKISNQLLYDCKRKDSRNCHYFLHIFSAHKMPSTAEDIIPPA